jgi:hypothetical protein
MRQTGGAVRPKTQEESMRTQAHRYGHIVLVVLSLAISGAAIAAAATKDEAIAMVKKAVAAINSEGPDKAYAEIDDPNGLFLDRDLYIVVCCIDGSNTVSTARKPTNNVTQNAKLDSMCARSRRPTLLTACCTSITCRPAWSMRHGQRQVPSCLSPLMVLGMSIGWRARQLQQIIIDLVCR